MLQLPLGSSSQLQRGSRFLRFCLASLVLMLSAGCISLPKRPDYMQVDRTTPEFKQAVATEKELQQAQGVPAARAEMNAERKVSEQVIESEKDRRRAQVVPLVQALKAFERPQGCWAYTVRTTTVTSGVTEVLVENFDASQPEKLLWTLVSRDGRTPDEKEQADYRAKKLREWRKQMEKGPAKQPSKEWVEFQATMWEMEITPAATAGQTTFTFTSPSGKLLLEVPSFRETYTIDPAKGIVVARSQTLLTPFSWLALGVKVTEFATSGEYALIDPSAPPLPVRTTFHGRATFMGNAIDLEDEEAVFTNYRRVKCYEDRFEVEIGELRVMPGK